MNPGDGAACRRKILETLKHAEKQCTELILDAVRAKDQVGIQVAGAATVRIREIIDELRHPVLDTSSQRPAPAKRSTEPKRKAYPRFHVEMEHLVKTGWSKKARKEYVHKVPRETFECLLDVIAEHARKTDQPFPADGIVMDAAELPESIPGYQVYLVLGFLRDRRVLQKNGRRGFQVLREIHEAGVAAWRNASNAR